MKWIKIVEVLLICISALCFLGSHLLFAYSIKTRQALFFGVYISVHMFMEFLVLVSLMLPLTVIVLIMKD